VECARRPAPGLGFAWQSVDHSLGKKVECDHASDTEADRDEGREVEGLVIDHPFGVSAGKEVVRRYQIWRAFIRG
jgi:hypothetical protein